MTLQLKKFGTTLSSRHAGREALAAIQPILRQLPADEKIEIDFDDIVTFTPSWADEVITKLQNQYGSRVVLKESTNPSVKATMELLESLKPTT